MCTRMCYGKESSNRGLSKLRHFVAKLQRSIAFLAAARDADGSDDDDDRFEAPSSVPEDVKEGHFVVLAVTASEKKRFVVKIECLSSPAFLRLLEQAEEEFGFEQTGAISVPCRPEELQKILKTRGGSEDRTSQLKI